MAKDTGKYHSRIIPQISGISSRSIGASAQTGIKRCSKRWRAMLCEKFIDGLKKAFTFILLDPANEILFARFFAVILYACNTTKIYLVRHAEKATTGADPALRQQATSGLKR